MSSNPMIKKEINGISLEDSRPMNISGAISKTFILLCIVVVTALYSWNLCSNGFSDKANLFLIIGAISGLILAIITAFKPSASPTTAPIYAICEGLVVGAISFSYGSMYDGIVMNAISITLLALFVMLGLYKAKILQATPAFKKVVFISTLAIMIFYLAGFIGALMGHPMTIFNGGILGICLSAGICIIAALNFVTDFDFIERGDGNLPSYFEWYGAFTLLVTLIWLYLEVLRLLAQLSRRD